MECEEKAPTRCVHYFGGAAMTTRAPTAIDTAFDAWQASHAPERPSDYEVRCMLPYLIGLLSALERDGTLPVKVAREVAYAFERHTEPRGTSFGQWAAVEGRQAATKEQAT